MPTFENTRASYRALWSGMAINAAKLAAADEAARRILAGIDRYKAVEQKTSVPWFFIGMVHLREGNLNFGTYLGNGQSLHHVTTIVPVGRGPFPDFTTGAVDALQKMNFTTIKDWSLERIAYCLEGFNGYGYRAHGVNSPYLWAGTNRYAKGKYIRDGVFDPNVIDVQLGSMAVLARLCALNADVNARVNGATAGVPKPPDIAPIPVPKLAPKPGTAGGVIGGAVVIGGGAVIASAQNNGANMSGVVGGFVLILIAAIAAFFIIRHWRKSS